MKLEARIETREQEYTSKIDLHFFRHSIKESDNIYLSDDESVKLSQPGKDLAKENAFSDVNMKQSLAYGSPRVRAQETAIFLMTGEEDEITGTETLDELKEKINKDLKVGSKIGVDPRLNFYDDPSKPVAEANYDAIDRREYLKQIVEKSDTIAKETNDFSGANYSHKAAQIAQIIGKYLKIGPRWNQLVEDKSKGYDDTLERFLGTHQGMGESFLAKVIEKIKGIQERDRFVQLLNNSGFDYIEGFNVEILNTQNGPKVHVSYKKDIEGKEPFVFNQEISPDLIAEIIAEGKA